MIMRMIIKKKEHEMIDYQKMKKNIQTTYKRNAYLKGCTQEERERRK